MNCPDFSLYCLFINSVSPYFNSYILKLEAFSDSFDSIQFFFKMLWKGKYVVNPKKIIQPQNMETFPQNKCHLLHLDIFSKLLWKGKYVVNPKKMNSASKYGNLISKLKSFYSKVSFI